MDLRKVCVLGFFAYTLLAAGCSDKSPIVDDITEYDLPIMNELKGNQFIYAIESDGMLYKMQYAFRSQLVVDPDYYRTHEIMRGDVVYIQTDATNEEINRLKNSAFDVVRVIALPGETVRIDKSQIYIDDRELKSFYGNEAFARGSEIKPDRTLNMEEVIVPDNHYFLIGDLWWRNGNNSIRSGPFSHEHILGKIIGWTGKIEGINTP
ncbi:signal peptidase I [Paenibacillus chibensis]|uniref:signal peptidase I n=1 Tax=Paenibacillus chibensis TaxID=59846 RepID=UPI0013E33180|nr:signal peptidase I [Paenibacillus chibensis]MEC0369462.1 signal peptidase I [Paenibacillus chibensis]